MYNKKLTCFLLLVALLSPQSGFCARTRDFIMVGTGVAITGLGLTFIIKSAKDNPDKPSPSLTVKPWFPTNSTTTNDMKLYDLNQKY